MNDYNKFTPKNIILTKQLNGVVYELMVKTVSDMVYVDDKTTLTEKLAEFTDLLVDNSKTFEEFKKCLNHLISDSEEQAEKLRNVWNYVNLSADPKSELIKLIESKVTSEEGKGLSTNDFTDIMKEKLVNNYSKEELDQKFSVISNNFSNINDKLQKIELLQSTTANIEFDSADAKDGDVWFDIIKN